MRETRGEPTLERHAVVDPLIGTDVNATYRILRKIGWGGMGTISRRFVTCNIQTRGVPLEPQADEYRDLEYYLSYVSNGLPISGPGARP